MNNHDEINEPVPEPTAHTSRFTERPATRPGRWALWSSLAALAALVIANISRALTEGDDSGTLYEIFEVVRVTLVGIFFLGGLGALALSLRGLKSGERSVFVWVALAIGALATTLLVLEFTVME